MRGNLKDNQAKLDSYEKSIKAALERKRKVIMESKQIAYDILRLRGTRACRYCNHRAYADR